VQRPIGLMELGALKNVSNCLNTNIYSYLETSGGEISNPYLNVVLFVLFSTPELIRNLWQVKTAVFLHWCLTRVVPLKVGGSASS
jgi:hypothetical protein